MRSEGGLTLIEVLVAATISVLVFGAVLTVLDVFQRDNRYDTLRNEAQDNTRNTIDALTRELRNGAAPSSTTPGALEAAEPESVVFQTIESHTAPSGENVKNAIRVRYCLETKSKKNEILWKQTKKWEAKEAPALPASTVCPDPSTTDYETKTQVVRYIVNDYGASRAIFKYVPATAKGPGEVTGVEPDIFLNVNPREKFPGETELTSTIDLRNENRVPTASFTAKELGSGHIVELNGSQSIDPDGLVLTYEWFDNGTKISGSASTDDTGAEEPGSKHVFKLTVTTPSGLKASAESAQMTIT